MRLQTKLNRRDVRKRNPMRTAGRSERAFNAPQRDRRRIHLIARGSHAREVGRRAQQRFPVLMQVTTMRSTVEMFRDATEAGGRDRFSCSLVIWDLLQEIGVEFGWAPSGSTYLAQVDAKFAVPIERNYQPGEAEDLKEVSVEDAMAWANALESALLSPLLVEMLTARAPTGVPHETLIGSVREFTEYCYGGAFAFAMR